MASNAPAHEPVLGRLDASGRLIAADPELAALQIEAGSELGQRLALPQIAAVADLARKLGSYVRRPAMVASLHNDVDLWVSARPDGDEIVVALEGWTVCPPAAPRFKSMPVDENNGKANFAGGEWAVDSELRITSISPDLCDLLGIDLEQAKGTPLTQLLRLEEESSGDFPLLSASAARRDFERQRARSRSSDGRVITLRGEVITNQDGSFGGFKGSAEATSIPQAMVPAGFDQTLDDLLQSPIDRIIESAERIGARSDGPLREDYASYGNDIASAARHLLSVVHSMRSNSAQNPDVVDLAALSAEAVIMLESSADERSLQIELDRPASLHARGDERAVLQVLVNLIVNAIRYSPERGIIRLSFASTQSDASVTVSDQGSGVAAEDEHRIFERFERAHSSDEGTGLGLAISRRLARAMGGDVTLDSKPGEGARFSLTLPLA